MRFYTGQHEYYCGVDLHARTLYLCVLDSTGAIRLHKRLRCEPDAFVRAIEPYRSDLVVGTECIFCWYWLADLCAHEQLDFVLGHALYMKAIHGGKAKNDKIDSHKTAVLLRGGAFPIAFVYPREMRATRDLLRRLACAPIRTGHQAGQRRAQLLQRPSNLPGLSQPFRGERTVAILRIPGRSSGHRLGMADQIEPHEDREGVLSAMRRPNRPCLTFWPSAR